MPGKAFVNFVAFILFFSALFPFLTAGSTFSRIEDGPAWPVDVRDQEDLSAMLRRAPFHEARVFEVARKHIQEMETSPACHQLATSTLINSCQSFSSLPGQDSARIMDNSLDEVRQEYAARLAVCELQGIKSGIPRECTPFVASREACPNASPRGFFRRTASPLDELKRACYPEFTPQQLKQCVDSLFDHGQRWTSYSNAQTNAIVICQASRGAVENEEHLHKLQNALQSQTSVSETLSRAVQETEERLAQHHEFAKAVQQFQHDLAARNEAALAQADSMVARLVGKVDSTTQALLKIFTNSVNTANDETNVLTNNIKAANDGLDKTRVALQELHDEAVVREEERAASQDLAFRGHQALTSDLQATLKNVRDVTVLDIVQHLGDIEATMIDYLGAQHQAFDDQIQEFTHTFTHTQRQVIQSLTSQYQIIEEHNQKIAEMDFGGLPNNVTTYIGLSFFVIILSRANFILGVAAAAGIGIHSLLGRIYFPKVPNISVPDFSTAASPTLVFLSQVSATIIIIVLVILGLAILVRNFIISRKFFGSALDVEVKREFTPYDV